MELTRLDKNQTMKDKITKLKSVFFFNLKNNCHESYQLSTKIRISSHLFFHEKQWNQVIVQEIFMRLKSESQNGSLRQFKKSIKIFEKVVSKPLKSLSISSSILIISIVPYFEM